MSDTNVSQGGVGAQGGANTVNLREAVRVWRRNMQNLREALIQGDLEAASGAFTALRGIDPSAPKDMNMSPKVVSCGATAFVDLYWALENGDLPGARRAFLLLMLSLKSSPPKHPRHRRVDMFEDSEETELREQGAWQPAARFTFLS